MRGACNLRCAAAIPVLLLVAIFLTPVGGVAQQAAPAPAADPQVQRLHGEAARMKDLVQQLHDEMRVTGDKTLSVKSVRLAQQIQALARQMEAELRQP